MTNIHNGYFFLTPIVGESNYTKALKKCYNDADAYKKGKSAFIDVELRLENHNRHDNKAVAVISPYGVIGYLSRNHARMYRQDYNEDLTVRAKIYSKDGSIFGAWVDLPYDEYDTPAKSKNRTKSNNIVDIPDYVDFIHNPHKVKTKQQKQPPPPPKPWKQQSVIEKIFTIVAYVITTVIVLVVLVVALAILYTICSFVIYAFKVFFL